MRKNRRNRDGFALIYTLWAVVILGVLLATLGMSVRSSIRFSSYMNDAVVAELNARSGVYRMISELQKQQEQLQQMSVVTDTPYGFWVLDSADWSTSRPAAGKDASAAPRPQDGFVVCEVLSEEAKFPLRSFDPRFAGKLTVLNPVEQEQFRQYLIRSKREGNISLAGMLQEGVLNYRTYSGAEGIPGIRELMSDYSTDGKLDVNRASADVLQLLPGVDADTAEAIRQMADKEPFARVEDLQHVPGVTPRILKAVKGLVKVRSGVFRIRSESQYGGISASAEAVVQVGGEKPVLLFISGG